jgi:hypothetical protein
VINLWPQIDNAILAGRLDLKCTIKPGPAVRLDLGVEADRMSRSLRRPSSRVTR